MKRLVIMTIGKTHTGKSTFAKALEQALDNSFVMDQDNHAVFINSFYEKLLPKQGPNTFKYAISQLIVDYAIENTNLHIIACNSNRNRKGRLHLLEGLYNNKQFIRILVHFDIPDDILKERVKQSKRNTNILRSASNFEQVLLRQQAESKLKDIVDPEEAEADYLFVIRDNKEVDSVIKKIVDISKEI